MYIMSYYEWSGWLIELNICIVQEQPAGSIKHRRIFYVFTYVYRKGGN